MNRLKKISILIVEDNPADIRLVQEILIEAGSRETVSYQLHKASNLQQASDLLARDSFDLVLLDLSLPDSDGLETVRRVLPLAGSCPVVVMSGHEKQTVALEAVQAGAQDYLVKGYVDPYSLPRAIHYAIERARANQALVESERKFRSLAEQSQDAIVLVDEAGLVIEWNLAAETLFGLNRADVIGKPIWEVQYASLIDEDRSPERLEALKRFLQAMFETGETPDPNSRVEFPVQRPDGSRRIVQSVVYPIQTERGFRVGSISRDVTEQKQSEAMVRLQSAALEAAANAIIVTDRQGLITWANPAFSDLTGYSLDEGFGRTPGELLKSGQQDREFYQELWETILAGEVWHGKIVNRAKDGHLYPEEMTITPVRNQAGEISHFVAIKQDISDRIKAEQELLRQAARAEALARTAGRLNERHDLHTVLLAVCEETIRALPVEAACVTLTEKSNRLASPITALGLPFEPEPNLIRAILGWDGQAHGLEPVQILVPDEKMVDQLTQLGLESGQIPRWIAKAVLMRGDQGIGSLYAISFREGEPLSAPDQALLRGLADEAAQAIINARLLEDTRERAVQLEVLYEAGLKLNSVIEARAQKEILFKQAMESLRASWATYFEYDPSSNLLTMDLAFGVTDDEAARLRELIVPLGSERGLVGLVAQTRKSIYLPDVRADERYVPIVAGVRSGLWVPVERNQELLGVIDVSSPEVDAFTEADRQLLQLYANQAAVALENTHLFEESRRKVNQLEALHLIDEAISGSFELSLVLEVVLAQITSQLGVDSADILLLHPASQTLRFAAGRGFRTTALQHTNLRIGSGYAGQAVFERRTILVLDLPENLHQFRYAPLLPRENFTAYLAVPLIAKGQIKGVLEIFHRSQLNSNPEWLKFMNTLATQAAIAIDNASLYNDLQHSNMELMLAYDNTLEGWAKALELRDMETEGHSRRVTDMTVRLAQEMGLRETEIVHIRRGSLLHDIGKMAIPDSILLKPGPLDAEEWKLMKMHPLFADQLLKPIAFLLPAADIPHCHHERWDGNGYPNGLSGEHIPLAARIFAVVDVWDALSSDRPYRPAWSAEKVNDYIEEQSGKHFDPKVVDAFQNLLNKFAPMNGID
jgi:PAS domain S-box-containing protein